MATIPDWIILVSTGSILVFLATTSLFLMSKYPRYTRISTMVSAISLTITVFILTRSLLYSAVPGLILITLALLPKSKTSLTDSTDTTPDTPHPLNKYILPLLENRVVHAYTILEELKVKLKGKHTIGTTAIYESLTDLLERELIYIKFRHSDPEIDNEIRAYYALTPTGIAEVARINKARASASE